MNKLEDHYIICGYGRVGQQIGREFRAGGLDYVVVDFGPERSRRLASSVTS